LFSIESSTCNGMPWVLRDCWAISPAGLGTQNKVDREWEAA
jgi:hypothetical protein